jgi:hypothetical protein
MTVQQITPVTGSRTTSGPGTYFVMVPGLTITLETWFHWPDATQTITIKDKTASDAPNITVRAPQIVGGLIESAPVVVMSTPGDELVFVPYLSGNTYYIGTPQGDSGGSIWWTTVPNVQHGDAIPAPGLPFINASGYFVMSQ